MPLPPRRLLLCLALALPWLGMPPSAQSAPPTRISIGTGGPQSDYFPVGTALCRMVNATRKQHGLRCAAETSDGSVANIKGVLDGEFDLGLAQGDMQAAARQGTGAFADGPQPRLRALFEVAPEVFTVMVDPASPIRSVADLRGKRVAVGPPGSGTQATTALVLAAHGIGPGDLAQAAHLKFVEMAPALCERKVDAFVFVATHPNPVFADAMSGCGARFLAVDGPAVDGLLAAQPHYYRAPVPADVYAKGAPPVPSFATRFAVVAADDLPDAVAYAVTRAVFENLDDFRKRHPSLAGLTREDAARTVLPLHPGAAAYFREVGLLPPAGSGTPAK